MQEHRSGPTPRREILLVRLLLAFGDGLYRMALYVWQTAEAWDSVSRR